jgi:hypothetical protein
MSFFDSLIDTPTYQSQIMSRPAGAPQAALPQTMTPPQGMAKGGLTAANENIKQIQIMKVIANYFKNKGLPVDKAMAGVQKEIENGLQLIPFESSVMGFKPLGKGVAQIHFFTVGTMKDLADDMKFFYKFLKDKGISIVYDSIPAPITIQMFQQLGAKVMRSDNPKYKFKASI